MVNPYQEMGKCTQCGSTDHVFIGGYMTFNMYNAILRCNKCSNVWTKIIYNNQQEDNYGTV